MNSDVSVSVRPQSPPTPAAAAHSGVPAATSVPPATKVARTMQECGFDEALLVLLLAPLPRSPACLSVNSSLVSLSNLLRTSKRSSSSSNDLLYERDRFRARLHTLNGSTHFDAAAGCDPSACDVCHDVGIKTTKLTHSQYLAEARPPAALLPLLRASSPPPCSPLDPLSTVFQSYTASDMGIRHLSYPQLEKVFLFYFNQPLPPTDSMFPWLHGLHEDNYAQRQFFLYQLHQRASRQRAGGGTSAGTDAIGSKPLGVRMLMTINAEPSLPLYLPVLKNGVALSEILQPIDTLRTEMAHTVQALVRKVYDNAAESFVQQLVLDCQRVNHMPMFLSLDPDTGVSLRNFHIQVAKLAMFSDLVVYRYAQSESDLVESIARVLRLAQRHEAYRSATVSQYHVFIIEDVDDAARLAKRHASLFTVKPATSVSSSFLCATQSDSPSLTNVDEMTLDPAVMLGLAHWDGNYQVKERLERTKMSAATKIHKNVWVGNVWDHHVMMTLLRRLAAPAVGADARAPGAPPRYCDPQYSIVSHDVVDPHSVITSSRPAANWRLLVHCHDNAKFPELAHLGDLLFQYTILHHRAVDNDYHVVAFPPAGSVGLGNCKSANLMAIINLCKLIFLFLLSTLQASNVLSTLIYCSDGCTELSLIVLCYLMYSHNIRLDEAMIRLHLDYGRPFYIFNSDVQILRKLEPLLQKFSPLRPDSLIVWSDLETLTDAETNEFLLGALPIALNLRLGYIDNGSSSEESDDESDDETVLDEDLATCPPRSLKWVEQVEGSLPSRILPYLYLGSLQHANNLTLLSALGIRHVISAGELLDWTNGHKFRASHDIERTTLNDGNVEVYLIRSRGGHQCRCVQTLIKVNNLQDDGIDELTGSLPTILLLIGSIHAEHADNEKILVHCRVGVSRSATIAVAEVMRRLNLSLAKAYLYVRVRRLNIVIQPNLRFMYELFKWEERVRRQLGATCLREIDWFVMCREIMRLNLPYLS